jgi:hypothetical protein
MDLSRRVRPRLDAVIGVGELLWGRGRARRVSSGERPVPEGAVTLPRVDVSPSEVEREIGGLPGPEVAGCCGDPLCEAFGRGFDRGFRAGYDLGTNSRQANKGPGQA